MPTFWHCYRYPSDLLDLPQPGCLAARPQLMPNTASAPPPPAHLTPTVNQDPRPWNELHTKLPPNPSPPPIKSWNILRAALLVTPKAPPFYSTPPPRMSPICHTVIAPNSFSEVNRLEPLDPPPKVFFQPFGVFFTLKEIPCRATNQKYD